MYSYTKAILDIPEAICAKDIKPSQFPIWILISDSVLSVARDIDNRAFADSVLCPIHGDHTASADDMVDLGLGMAMMLKVALACGTCSYSDRK